MRLFTGFLVFVSILGRCIDDTRTYGKPRSYQSICCIITKLKNAKLIFYIVSQDNMVFKKDKKPSDFTSPHFKKARF
jgi:hypothetical protein